MSANAKLNDFNSIAILKLRTFTLRVLIKTSSDVVKSKTPLLVQEFWDLLIRFFTLITYILRQTTHLH